MAGLKKPSRKKESTNPNVVIVIFLVFFVLLSIGLGVWGYSVQSAQEKFVETAKNLKKENDSKRLAEDYRRVIGATYHQALGFEISDEEKENWKQFHDELVKPDSKFKSEKTFEEYKKGLEEARKFLGYEDAKKEFATTYPKEIEKLKIELDTFKKQYDSTLAKLNMAEKRFKELKDYQENAWKKAQDEIVSGNAEALKASQSKSDEVLKIVTRNKAYEEENQKLLNDLDIEKEKLNARTRKFEQELKMALSTSPDGRNTAIARSGTDAHALIMDVSAGKPLWDKAIGKLMRVDMGTRLVTLNLGSSSNIQPELTFLVFGPAPTGGGERNYLKGTIEIVRVLDANTSQGKITSLYDANGEEIPLAMSSQLRVQTEAASTMRDGDLLYNMFWGTRVALAGPVTLSDSTTSSPTEQNRQRDDFIRYLERLGISVDAYVDMNDGQVKGMISSKTRYLIAGRDLRPEERETNNGKLAAESMFGMKKEAIEQGMLIVSNGNFLVMSGYRRPRSVTSSETLTFRPMVPSVGIGVQKQDDKAAPMP